MHVNGVLERQWIRQIGRLFKRIVVSFEKSHLHRMAGPVLGVAKSKSMHVGAPQIGINSHADAGYFVCSCG